MEIDYMTCTLDDVIARSLTMHPSLLADAMRWTVQVHISAAHTMIDGEACRIAARMSCDAQMCVDLIDAGELTDAVCVAQLSFSRRLMLFTAAARLNCLPYTLAHSIARRAETLDPLDDPSYVGSRHHY